MIYTLTMNPSIDCLAAANFTKGQVNAVGAQALHPCGKGINVSVLLTRLGVPNTALGLCAGFTGKEIARLLEQAQQKTDFCFLSKGDSRINFKLHSPQGETELNGAGPPVEAADLAALTQKLTALQAGDCLVLSGSLPPNCPPDFYAEILRKFKGNGINCVVDTANLLPLLPHAPFLVKPNHIELAAMLQLPVDTPAQAIAAGQVLLAKGAQQVLVSMGEQGAVFVSNSMRLFVPALKGKVLSPCGAGDSMVAGFLYGLPQGIPQALRWGTAAGAATAFCAGIATAENVRACYKQLGEIAHQAFCKIS